MPENVQLSAVPRAAVSSRKRAWMAFGLQATLWIALSVAFAGLIELADMAPRSEALLFSATNWLPWIVLAPVIFWLAQRFPFESGQLRRAVPIHLAACALCCTAMLWIGAYFAPSPRRMMMRDGRVPFRERFESMRPPVAGEASGAEAGKAESGPEAGRPRLLLRPPDGMYPPLPDDAVVRAPEGGLMKRWPEGRMRGPGGGPPMPGMRHDRFLTRFWPPFSGIVLRANVSAAIYLIIACFAHAFSYYRRAKERESEAIALAAGLSRAKLDALRLQLQPHFLFNTLNAISTLVHRDANAADELIGDLSELLRLSLQTSQHEVPLSRELELLDCYLAIERTRLGERLKVVREIQPEALQAYVPTFVLQPLAENAIRHGIEPSRAGGTLTLRADIVGGNLRLVVSDDGVGIRAGANQRGGRRGIGLANTEERLRALHGDQAHLDLVAPEAGGVQVQIVLPRRATPAAFSATAANTSAAT
jgi:hypothetical protein